MKTINNLSSEEIEASVREFVEKHMFDVVQLAHRIVRSGAIDTETFSADDLARASAAKAFDERLTVNARKELQNINKIL